MANINKIRLSGQTYNIEDSNAPKTVELTQAQYDALAVKDPNTFYIITDAQGADLSQYYTSAQTESAITQAVSAKQDTLVSGTNIKTINNESILGSGNIDIQGGGKAVSAGTNISITTGETADTINCTLPISAGTGTKSIKIGGGTSSGINSFAGGDNAIASGNWSFAFGRGKATNNYAFAANGNSKATRDYSAAFNTSEANNTYAFSCGTSKASGHTSFASGWDNKSLNNYESSFGYYNVSNKANGTWGDSGNTLFSVGNGTADNARHNAFEIRQNGDIYCSDGTNDVKLQDTITATAANTTALGGLKLVKLTQSEYDALSTKDSNTLYVIVN